MIPTSSPQKIKDAIRLFDQEWRSKPEWIGWEDNNAHRYAILEAGKRYPVKEIVSLATGVPKDQFKGGEEAIRFVENLGFLVEALRLPTKANVKMAIHDFLLGNDPNPISKQTILDAIAKRFALSGPSKASNTWISLVDQVIRELEDEQVATVAPEGVVRLKERATRRYWVEKTLVNGRTDRMTGPFALGEKLWSPQRDKSDGDTYRLMRYVQPGDIVLHLVDNRELRGFSKIASRPRISMVGLANTDWAGRPCYEIDLVDYREITPPIDRKTFLGDKAYRAQMEELLKGDNNLFFNRDLDLNQGAYLTEAPQQLLHVFDSIHQAQTGQSLLELMEEKSITLIDRKRLSAAQQLFLWIFGEEAFNSPSFIAEERAPKEELIQKWRSIASVEKLSDAISSGQELALCRAIHKIINPDNLLPWRYSEFIRKIDDGGAKTFVEALRNLLSSDTPDISKFNVTIRPLLEAEVPAGGLYAASSSLPSFFLWLTRRDTEFFIRRQSYENMCKVLRVPLPEKASPYMTSEDYQFAKAVAGQIKAGLSEINPQDMIDVQSLCWRVFSIQKVWFGGKTYDGKFNKLPDFLSREVFAVGFEQTEEVHRLIESALESSGRKEEVRAEFLATLDSAASNALSKFLDLASSKDSLIFAKSTYYDNARKESLLRVYAVGTALGGLRPVSNDLGHETPVKWLSEPDFITPAGAFYPKINSTLSSLTLDETFDLLTLSQAAAQVQPNVKDAAMKADGPKVQTYNLDDFVRETGYSKDTAQQWFERLTRKGQLIFQGPPGTGKTFIAERLAKVLTAGTESDVALVQFHPTYGYEDFILGLRPQITDEGSLSYNLEEGHFVRFCERARDSGKPHVLIIDEMNRANLSRVFGELMYLMEYRDREVLLAGREKPFSIPDNVFIIGTMNTADRSIALVDHALRRRFSFVYLAPDYEILHRRLERDGLPAGLPAVLESINREIGDRNYEVGISFFMKDGAGLRGSLESIWKGEIESYLEEYFFDKPTKVDALRWTAISQAGLRDWL